MPFTPLTLDIRLSLRRYISSHGSTTPISTVVVGSVLMYSRWLRKGRGSQHTTYQQVLAPSQSVCDSRQLTLTLLCTVQHCCFHIPILLLLLFLVLTSIQLLLAEPNPDDGLMADISSEYKHDRPRFLQTAKQWVKKYATEDAMVVSRKRAAEEPESCDELRPKASRMRDT